MSFEEDSIKDAKIRLLMARVIADTLIEENTISAVKLRKSLINNGVQENVFLPRVSGMLRSALESGAMLDTGKTEQAKKRSTKDKSRRVKVYQIADEEAVDSWLYKLEEKLNDTIVSLLNIQQDNSTKDDPYYWADNALCTQLPWAYLTNKEKKSTCLSCEVFFSCRKMTDIAEKDLYARNVEEVYAGETPAQRFARRERNAVKEESYRKH